VLDAIRARGGAVEAIESGYMQREIANSAFLQEQREQTGEKPIVGVNVFSSETEERELVVHASDGNVAMRQREQLAALKASRDGVAVEAKLRALVAGAEGDANLIPLLIECARVDATLGEMVNALKPVFGEFREPV
jgi:methylmalonyl-CoA mutase N-terminal domain/subunit